MSKRIPFLNVLAIALLLASMSSCNKYMEMLSWGYAKKVNELHGRCPDPRTDGEGFRAIIDSDEVFAYTSNGFEIGMNYSVSKDESQYRLAVVEPLALINKEYNRPIIRDCFCLKNLSIRINSGEPINAGQHFVFTRENKTENHCLTLVYQKYLNYKFSDEYCCTGIGEAIITDIDSTNCHFVIEAVFVNDIFEETTFNLTDGLLICPYVYRGTF